MSIFYLSHPRCLVGAYALQGMLTVDLRLRRGLPCQWFIPANVIHVLFFHMTLNAHEQSLFFSCFVQHYLIQMIVIRHFFIELYTTLSELLQPNLNCIILLCYFLPTTSPITSKPLLSVDICVQICPPPFFKNKNTSPIGLRSMLMISLVDCHCKDPISKSDHTLEGEK